MESKRETESSAYSFRTHFISLLTGAAAGGGFAVVAGFSSDATFVSVFVGAIVGEIIGVGINAANKSGEV